ncbi:unnamed protein product [Periconia digitata]|uniref:Uncharacterized protein n=1 Tax=Periconia digitata TaxID=1303443 RepID=A0A9W4UFD8_9PLEO|nr:unnamed protein product [Periconia digitata]
MYLIMALIVAFVAAVMGIPHKAIIDTPSIRDVGLAYTEANYQGISLFLLENREDTSCYPLSLDAANKPQ